MKRWNVALTGYGTVGKKVAELLLQRNERYQTMYGADVRLIAVSRSQTGMFEKEGLTTAQLDAYDTSDKKNRGSASYTGVDFLASCKADVLIEAGPTDFQTGGASYQYLKAALTQGMHAISISKGALVLDYAGLQRIAKSQNVLLKISGATAAALPTIDLFQYNLAGCEIGEIEGIFTGTTNFLLTSMMEKGVAFDEALREAQRLGIAEPNPQFDVEGWDTACKITIIANAAFGADLTLADVKKEGIQHITLQQIEEWKVAQVVPKLVGSIIHSADGVQAFVKLQFYPQYHAFAQVSGTTKAIRVTTDVMGELLVIGGKSDPMAAAAAALKDLEHILQKHS